MTENEGQIGLKEKPSSIEVSENAKGQYSFSVKLYFSEDTENGVNVINRITEIYNELHKRFR